MRLVRLIKITAVVSLALPFSSPGQEPSETRTVVIQKSNLPANAATIEQFRDYLQLSGVGEVWRASWIAAVDTNRDKGAPYWPESFWIDLKDEMRKTDLAPVVWGVYAGSFTQDTMHEVNATLRAEGIQGLTSTKLGQKFCADWATRETAGQAAILGLTQTTIQRVYNVHKAEIQLARVKYLKDPQL